MTHLLLGRAEVVALLHSWHVAGGCMPPANGDPRNACPNLSALPPISHAVAHVGAHTDLVVATALASKKNNSPPIPRPYLARMVLKTPEMDRLDGSFDFQKKLVQNPSDDERRDSA